MAITKFTIPTLNDSKPEKWLIRYTIHIDGKPEYRKEVGTTYPQLGDTINSKNMRSLSDRKRREFAKDIIELLVAELEDGVDPENSKEGYLLLNQKRLEAQKEWHISTMLDFYFAKVGLKGKVPDRKLTTQYNLKMFFNNQFIPYFKEKGLANDIRQITRQHIRDYLDYHYESSDPNIKWSYRTVNVRRAWISAFFKKLVEYDYLPVNPVDAISSKKADGTGRGDYEIYSVEEIEKMMEAAKSKGDLRLQLIIKIMYYAFIRGSEMRRITMKNIDLNSNKFIMSADISKKNNKGQSFSVMLHPDLVATLKEWIEFKNIDITNSDYPLFPNAKGLMMCRKFHEVSYNKLIGDLRIQNPKLFNKPNQTIYSLKSSGVTHTFYKHREKPDVLKFIQSQCRHAHSHTTEIYLKKLDCKIEEQANLSYFE